MSEVNWDLIEKLSRRFDALVGIATEERLQQMYDNFHLVSVVLDGRFEEYMREFVPIQPPADAKSADLAGARERLRQYNLPQFPQETVRSIAETAGLFFPERYSDEFGREKADSAQSVRMKLLRFDRPMSFLAIERVLRAKELTPATLPQLATFALVFPDDQPAERLVATGSLAVGATSDGEVSVAFIAKPDKSGLRILDRVSAPGFHGPLLEPGEVVLAARYPRERKSGQSNDKASIQGTKESAR